MKIIRFEELQLQERAHARGGVFRYYDLMSGQSGAPDNFYLSMGVLSGDFLSPRHRHNFDQVRFQLEGSFDFSADGRMDPGSIAYFPEGTRYGPQKSLSEASKTLVLQNGGASGNGYMSEAQFQKGLAELQEHGTFQGGVFTRLKPTGGKINQDAYEAVWEHVNGRELVYPVERYAKAVFMNPAGFAWLPNGPGRQRKELGVFNERGSALSFERLEPGARLPLEQGSIYFVCEGAGESAGQRWARWSTLLAERGERPELRAAVASEILQMRLPRFEEAVAQRRTA
jgi:hypothetical protein